MTCFTCGSTDKPAVRVDGSFSYCGDCLIKRIDAGWLFVSEHDGECENCSNQAEYCSNCGSCDYDHDDPSCPNCGSCEHEATLYCSECHECENESTCDECGKESGDDPDDFVYCKDCAQEIWQTTPIHPAMIVAEDGSMTIGDQEVRWN